MNFPIEAGGVVRGFVHEGQAVRVIFGNGAVAGLADEANRLGFREVTVVSTPAVSRRATRLARVLSGQGGTPTVRVCTLPNANRGADVERVVAAARGGGGFLAVGGGAAITAARQAAAIAGLPVIALPTTYAGREMSALSGRAWSSEDGVPTQTPTTVIYDPVLTTTLPHQITGVSALAALSRAALALCSGAGSPLADVTAGLAIRYLAEGAHDAVLHPRGLVGRSRALYGAHLVGLLTSGSRLDGREGERALDDTLAEVAGVHRSDVEALLLPYRLDAARRDSPLAVAAVAAALRQDDAVAGVLELAAAFGAPTSFPRLGLSIDRLAAVRAAIEHIDVSRAEGQVLKRALTERSSA